MPTDLGTLEPVDLRTIWPDEARDFTPWLAQEDNLSRLPEALNPELELDRVEVGRRVANSNKSNDSDQSLQSMPPNSSSTGLKSARDLRAILGRLGISIPSQDDHLSDLRKATLALRPCAPHKLAKRALKVVQQLGVTMDKTLVDGVLRDFGRSALDVRISSRGGQIRLRRPKGGEERLRLAWIWIEIADQLACHFTDALDQASPSTTIPLENACKKLQVFLANHEQTQLRNRHTKQANRAANPSNACGGKHPKGSPSKVEHVVRYSKEHHAWIVIKGRQMHQFDTQDLAITAAAKLFGPGRFTVIPQKGGSGFRKELPSNSVWSGEWDKLNK